MNDVAVTDRYAGGPHVATAPGLTSTYLGLPLRNPIVASASPLTLHVDGVRALAEAGVGAIVLYSLFEEQVHREQLRDMQVVDAHEDAFAEALSYFPRRHTPEPGAAHHYLKQVERAVGACDVPSRTRCPVGARGGTDSDVSATADE